MAWTFLDEADDDSLTAAEWEQIYLLVNGVFPHAEVDVDPLHCPTCRIAHATVLIARETTFVEALTTVAAMPAVALVDAFDVDGG